jgi:hypothetical protein
MAVRLPALRASHPLPPRKIPAAHFCYRLSRPQDHNAAEKIRSIEKFSDFIGIRTDDLPACSIVPQPTTLQRALYYLRHVVYITFYAYNLMLLFFIN